jgi:TonB family protein
MKRHSRPTNAPSTTSIGRSLFVALLFAGACCAVQAAEPACSIEVTLAGDFDDFYPPGPIRRHEQGEVFIEFTALPGDSAAKDIEVVRGSGFADLDKAATKLIRALKVSSPCAERRERWAVRFDLGPWDKKSEGHGYRVAPAANVLLVRDESDSKAVPAR